MTELQEKELEIFKLFINVCEKMNLTYYLVCGSALGAVKYQGFIPWDDDIDVGMPREDYELFCKYAKSYLPRNIFIQNYRTDPEFPQIYCKLRDSNTTYIEETASRLNINHGIFIDIFPLDGYPQSTIQTVVLECKKRLFQSILLSAFEINRSGKSETFYKLIIRLGINKKTNLVAKFFEKMVKKYRINDSQFIVNHGNWQGKLEYAPKHQYGNGFWTEFEGIKVCVPEKFDEYLTQKYGDWRSDLPEGEKKGHHYYKICDVNQGYINYIHKEK